MLYCNLSLLLYPLYSTRRRYSCARGARGFRTTSGEVRHLDCGLDFSGFPRFTLRGVGPRTVHQLKGRRFEISVPGEAGSWALVVGRVTRPPFPLSIHFVPNNLTSLVVKGRGCFQLGCIGSCFRRARYRSRGRRWAGRSRRDLWLWGDPSRQGPVSDRRNRESELHGAVGSFSTSQNLHRIIYYRFGRHVSCGDQPCESSVVANSNNIYHFRKYSLRVAIDRPL
jgi:hypothetical protein